jgi:hypothetical protein
MTDFTNKSDDLTLSNKSDDLTLSNKSDDLTLSNKSDDIITPILLNITYCKSFVSEELSNEYFTMLDQMFQTQIIHNVKFNDKIYKLRRKTMVFIDESLLKSNTIKFIIPKIWGDGVEVRVFPPEIVKLKNRISNLTSFAYNICLLNYYANGKKYIGFHSDNEEKGQTENIASISLGATRQFAFRKKQSNEICQSFDLSNGDLIIMGQNVQENYEHSLLADQTIKSPRINLTFRVFDFNRYVSL